MDKLKTNRQKLYYNDYYMYNDYIGYDENYEDYNKEKANRHKKFIEMIAEWEQLCEKLGYTL